MVGTEYPVEMHIVSFVDKAQMPGCTYHPNGCIAVTGILFDVRDGEAYILWFCGLWFVPAVQTILAAP